MLILCLTFEFNFQLIIILVLYMKLCYIFTKRCPTKQHCDDAGTSPFPIRGVECELNIESEDDYLEEQHESEDDCVDDEDIPSTGVFIQHPNDPLSFMRVLDLDAMQAHEFLETWLVVILRAVNCVLEWNSMIGRL